MDRLKDNVARRAAVRIAMQLRDAGHVAYLAGGCVRDELLGLIPKDYDVATDARPEQVREHFPQSKYVGEAFGVVLVRMMKQEVEVATFRTEWGYVDGRRPGEIQFSDDRHDALRRDFTINGLFEDPATDAIIDYVGGQADLKAGIIRAIGDADERFAEDYLRMLRAVRFAARLAFTIEPGTAAAIAKHADKLAQISRERIGQEVEWMLTGLRPARAAELLQTLQLDSATLLETHQQCKAPILAGLDDAPGYACALVAWLLDRHLFGEDGVGDLRLPAGGERVAMLLEVLRGWRGALCLSNEVHDAAKAIVTHLPDALAWRELSLAKRKRLLAQSTWADLASLLRALALADGAMADRVEQIECEAGALMFEGVAPPPLVTGDDLIAMGLPPGPAFRRILEAAYDEQLEHRLTTRQAALDWVRRHTGDLQ